jgi:hypothetical protein
MLQSSYKHPLSPSSSSSSLDMPPIKNLLMLPQKTQMKKAKVEDQKKEAALSDAIKNMISN